MVRQLCATHAEEWGRLEMEETGIGRLDHKIEKLRLIRHVLGVEAMRTEARTDVNGTCIIEGAPWGVVGMALPATHSAPTMASNAINVLAAGNAAVFSPHPAGARIAARALQAFNRGIERSRASATSCAWWRSPRSSPPSELFEHPDVALICVTGRPAVVSGRRCARGKRVIAAGPGQPAGGRRRDRRPRSRGPLHHCRRGLRQQPALHRREGSLRGRAPWPTHSWRR